MRILAFGDIHGNVDAMRLLVEQVKDEKYDALVCVGDFTNLILTTDFEEAQKQFDKMMDFLY